MTLGEDIKILNEFLHRYHRFLKPNEVSAIRLGKEALELLREFRTGHYKTINSPLLGESNK